MTSSFVACYQIRSYQNFNCEFKEKSETAQDGNGLLGQKVRQIF